MTTLLTSFEEETEVYVDMMSGNSIRKLNCSIHRYEEMTGDVSIRERVDDMTLYEMDKKGSFFEILTDIRVNLSKCVMGRTGKSGKTVADEYIALLKSCLITEGKGRGFQVELKCSENPYDDYQNGQLLFLKPECRDKCTPDETTIMALVSQNVYLEIIFEMSKVVRY